MELSKISITNFKGIKSLELNFQGSSRISGQNGSGKTSIYDAFLWCLFGKDSEDRKDFEIKPLDKKGKVIERQDTEVSVWMDGVKYTKVFREKWTRKRGEEVEEYTGNETVCSIQDVPLTATQYNGKVAELISQDVFKLLTNVYAFPSLHWTERRKLLMAIAGDVSNDELLAVEPKLAEIIHENLVDYAKVIGAKKKKIQSEVDTIPARTDEVRRGIPEYDEAEHQRLKNLKVDSNSEVRKIRLQLEEQLEILMSKGRMELTQMRAEEAQAETSFALAVKGYQDEYARLQGIWTRSQAQIAHIDQKLVELRSKWTKVKAEEFSGKCPTCGGVMTDSGDFNESKARRLKEINEEGSRLKSERDELHKVFTKAQDDRIELVEPVKKSTKVSDDTFWSAYKAMPEIRLLRQKLENLPAEETVDDSRLKELDAMPGQIAQAEARLEELTTMLREGNKELAKIQKHEMLIAKFWKLKVQMLDERLAEVFPGIRFRLFKPQLNGGEEPACDVLINGVPFTDANHASKINAGLEIIEALGKHYNKKAPVFIDNAEAVLELRKFDGQVICLNVAKGKLKLENL